MKPSHGEINYLDEHASKKLLDAKTFGHLGYCFEGQSWVEPVSYAYEDGRIYCHSRPGEKIGVLRLHPRLCLQVEDILNFFHWKSVIVTGFFTELDGDEAAKGMRTLIDKLSATDGGAHRSALAVDMTAQLESSVLFEIKIKDIVGRFESQ